MDDRPGWPDVIDSVDKIEKGEVYCLTPPNWSGEEYQWMYRMDDADALKKAMADAAQCEVEEAGEPEVIDFFEVVGDVVAIGYGGEPHVFDGKDGHLVEVTWYDAAEKRVLANAALYAHKDTILDCDNKEEHLRWVCEAPAEDIIGWAMMLEESEAE